MQAIIIIAIICATVLCIVHMIGNQERESCQTEVIFTKGKGMEGLEKWIKKYDNFKIYRKKSGSFYIEAYDNDTNDYGG